MSSPPVKFSVTAGILLAISVLGLTGCGHDVVRQVPDSAIATGSAEPVVQPDVRPHRRTAGQNAATIAVRQIGVPYRYGGATSQGFDCSGLAQFAYAHAGMPIPRTTAQQWQQLSPVSKDRLQVGDILFFRIEGRIAHVGLYLGKDRFVHAPSSGREVSIAQLDSAFYSKAFVRGGRP
jgi:murein DD-endopeptidase